VDHDLFAAINGLAGKERLVDMLAVALSRFGPYLLDIALAFFGFSALQLQSVNAASDSSSSPSLRSRARCS